MKKVDYPVVYIARPKLRISFSCMFCGEKYKTTNIILNHTCEKCKKPQSIRNENYSLDATNYYLGIAMNKLKDVECGGIIFRATDSYVLIMIALVDTLQRIGIRVIKNHKVMDKNKKKNIDIEVNEVVMEKMGAIRDG